MTTATSTATSTPTGPAVRLLRVTKTHHAGAQRITALDGVTHDFPRGTLTAVMGASGSGKSTLLQCAAGIDRADGGEIRVDGVDVRALDEHESTLFRRSRVGFVFQSFNLVSALTAEQNVALPLRLAGRRPDPARVAAALAEVGLADRARHRPAELSGGQRQRVAIARALVTRPAVVFADEPTGALDSKASREVLRLLRDAVDARGRTVVMVTHDPTAAAFADRVVLLTDGRVADEIHRGADGAGISAETIAARMAWLEELC
ncbi:ABC transporter ATP-binding protein [Embleya sp. NPDC056575]|uniref:ABC transporter ATP-binding protein n=1 Tax=unclassified Embleya TaxID=2699296 RepID=UPI0036C696A8